MMLSKRDPCSVHKGPSAFGNGPASAGVSFPAAKIFKKQGKLIFFLAVFFAVSGGLYAQTDTAPEYQFPLGDFWSLDAGVGMSNILVKGTSYQLIIDPKLWLSPAWMVGSKVGINYSAEDKNSSNTLSNILTFEGQVYLRWNFLRFGKAENPWNLFGQVGLGLIASYRGDANPLDDVTETRGSVLADGALGLTIPLTDRWHLEPQVRGGYPHVFGFSLTAGYKFPLPRVNQYNNSNQTIVNHIDRNGTPQYVEVIRQLPPEEIIKRVMITSIEFILFGPDIGKYNIGIDRDAQQLNEMILDQTAKMLKDNPALRVRIEGHANPYTINVSEIDELMTLSAMRADTVASQLKARGVSEDQMVIIHYGGTRTATSDWDIRNRNRRVEMILLQVDDE